MEVTYKEKSFTLGKKDRKVEGEAPAVRVKMLNNETMVIGLMAPAVQVMVTLNDVNKYNSALHEVITTTKKKVNAYVITTSPSEQLEEIAEKFAIDKGFISNDFKDFSLKFGVTKSFNDLPVVESIKSKEIYFPSEKSISFAFISLP